MCWFFCKIPDRCHLEPRGSLIDIHGHIFIFSSFLTFRLLILIYSLLNSTPPDLASGSISKIEWILSSHALPKEIEAVPK